MAAAAITLTDGPATIESDTTGAVITNGSTEYSAAGASSVGGYPKYSGELRNHGPADVWLKISSLEQSPAATADVVTTGAQAQAQVPLPAGSSIPVYKDYRSIAHKTIAGTAVLSWVPVRMRF